MWSQSQDELFICYRPFLLHGRKGRKVLKARGGFEVDIQWENGELAMATIKSLIGGNCRLRSYGPLEGKGLKYAQGLI